MIEVAGTFSQGEKKENTVVSSTKPGGDREVCH